MEEKDEKLGAEIKRVDDDDANSKKDEENQVQTYKYPKQVAFIISNEFCERFNYYGMRTILVLYLTRKLLYDEDTATVIYHSFTSCVYFMCVLGAIVADSWLGKYRTILFLSLVYVGGSAIITLGAIPTLGLPATAFTIIGLLLIAVGSGGIKPCVAAFGGDQFKMPEQAKQLGIFFSLFYFAINAGSLISTSITPILREEVKCFGDQDCFSIAFGVPGVLMCVSIVIFMCGKFMYTIKEPTGNMIVLVSKCIGNALATRSKQKKTNPREHWLDYAIPVHGKRLVEETKIVLKVLLLYIPLPIFWALFDQQGSRWTFQATRMDGSIGDAFTIKPDQMQVVNPLLILIFIPLYDVAFYPLLAKVGIKRPLQKLTLGGILAGIAFLISAGVELELEKTYPVLPKDGQTHLRIFNGMPCVAKLNSADLPFLNSVEIKSLSFYENKDISSTGKNVTFEYSDCITPTSKTNYLATAQFQLDSKVSRSIFLKETGVFVYDDDPSKSRNGYPLLRVLSNSVNLTAELRETSGDQKHDLGFTGWTDSTVALNNVPPGKYNLFLGKQKVEGELELKLGAVYTTIVKEETASYPTGYAMTLNKITEENSLHMAWIIPQYVVLTLGEVMYSVTGLEFSYSQAPPNMKSVLQGGWQLTVGVGNLIVAIVAESKGFSSQADEFFLFAGLMFLDMLIFSILAYFYVYVEPQKDFPEEDDDAISNYDSNAIAAAARDSIKKSEKSGFDNPGFKND